MEQIASGNPTIPSQNLPQTSHSQAKVFMASFVFVLIVSSIIIPLAIRASKNKPQVPNPYYSGYYGNSGYKSSPAVKAAKPLEFYETATSTWSSKFNIQESNLPPTGYKVIYFDRRNSAQTATKEDSKVVALNLNWTHEDKYRTDMEHLGVYWIGKKDFPEKGNYKFTISPGWSRARLLIDKKVVFEATNTGNMLIELEKGEHLIEIEFLSAVGTPQLDFTIISETEAVAREKQSESDAFIPGIPVWYVGIYESSKPTLEVILPENKGDVTLILNSYEVTKWNIIPAKGTKVLSILVSSFNPGSEVFGMDASTKVVYAKDSIGILYEIYPKCPVYRTGPSFYCENLHDYKTVFARIRQFSKDAYISTFTGTYSTSSLKLPQRNLSANEESLLDAYADKLRDEWERDRNTVN